MNYIIYDLALFLVCLFIFVIITKNSIHLKKIFALFLILTILVNYSLFNLLNLKYHQFFNLILLDTSFILIYLELISILERGYTLNILKSISNHQGEVTLKNVHEYYSSKRGLLWLYKKRINSLLNLKLIIINNDKIKLTKLGNIIAILLNLSIKLLMIKRSF
tara:strand:- start:28 stop:516 length:489 start_codon:yes stop_codon:yes gene_type:complete